MPCVAITYVRQTEGERIETGIGVLVVWFAPTPTLTGEPSVTGPLTVTGTGNDTDADTVAGKVAEKGARLVLAPPA